METLDPLQQKVPDSPEQESPEVTAPGFENLASDPILAKDALQFCKDLFTTLAKKRKPFELMWAQCNDAFRCVEGKTWFEGSAPYCSSDLRDSVLSIVPKLAKSIWYQDIPFDLIPIGKKGDDEELVEINKKVLEFDFRNLKVYGKYVDQMFQKAIFGTSIVKTPPHWEEVTRHLKEWSEQPYGGQTHLPGKKILQRSKSTERTFMGTDFIVTDIFDFWIDPATVTRGMNDAVEYGDCIESILIKESELKAGEASGIYVNIDKIKDFYVGTGGKRAQGSNDDGNKQRVKRAAHMSTSDQSGARTTMRDKGNKLYEIKEHYVEFDLGEEHGGLQRVLIVTCADKEVIRIQKWEGDKPYLTSRYTPNGYNKEFYGTGIIETNLSNHYERNATRKQILMARTMGLNMEMLSDQTGFMNRPDKLRTRPNGIHYVRNIMGVKPFDKPIGQILQSGIAWETNLKSETQTSTGNTPYVQGTDTSKINDTAAGIAQLTQSGNEKFTLPLQVDESGMLEPYVKRSLENNITYRSESFVIRLTDKQPLRIEPDQLSANFDVYCNGSTELQNKAVRQAGLMKAWEISMSAAETETVLYGQPLTNFIELKKEIFANLGLSNPENFTIDPAQMQGKLPVLTPEHEWILLKRMADGIVPLMPIMIQPGEDYKEHYEDHKAKTLDEEFQLMPEPVKQVWFAHLAGYEKLLHLIEKRKKETMKDREVEQKEVAIGQ